MTKGVRRLGRAAQELLASSYSRAKRQVLLGHLLVNGTVVTDPGVLVGPGDVVAYDPNLPRRARTPKTPPIEILHLDADVLVVDKPAGLLVHPTAEGDQDTVLSRAAAELERRTGRHRRLLVVHRLDRDTSGLLVLAMSHAAAEQLQRQFRAHSVERRYVALVRGNVAGEVMVTRGIGRPRPGARRAALAPGTGGQPAHTVVRPLEQLGGLTLVEAELGTGRTHQVRVHLSYLGHPVLGDPIYGEPASDPIDPGRLALHAVVLGFTHPTTGQRLEFRSEPPRDFKHALELARRRQPRQHLNAVPRRSRPDQGESAAATAPPRPRTQRRHAGAAAPRPPGRRPRPKPARSHRRT